MMNIALLRAVSFSRFSRSAFVSVALLAGFLAACTVKNSPKVDPDAAVNIPTPDAPVTLSCEPGTPSENREIGQSCGCDQQCGSGACVAGVCCTSRCGGACQACDLPSKVGTCSPVPEGQAPSDPTACPKDPGAPCGLEGTCDGKGECRKYPDNTICKAGACNGSSISGTMTCRNGECTAGINQICAPFTCNVATSACFMECTKDQDCAEGRTCKAGSCGVKSKGQACKVDSECESGRCVDEVCCNTACEGACLTCNDPFDPGVCLLVKSGVEDPRKLCVTDNASTCGFSGLCNGQGGCSRYDASTVCQVASCAGASVMPEAKCNGQGNCVLSSAFGCAPSICSDGACKTECESNADCIAPATCNNKSCGKRGPGQACTSADQCQSNFCADGVCCNEACGGQCRNCALANSRGQCVNVPANTMDPRIAAGVTNASLVCKDEGAASCGTSGMCNGAGACSRYPSGTQCKAGSCDPITNTSVAPSTCNGNGACLTPAPLTCAPFRCSANRCSDVCGTSNDCVAPNVCTTGGSCGKKGNGQACAASEECSSAHCEQGICCGTACDRSCFSCAIPGKEGSCSAVVAGGLDPKAVCKDNGTASCGTDGTCNGSGSCRLYSASTMCQGQSCSSGISTAAAFCSGTGICIAGATRLCDPYVCNASGTACFDSCISAAECKAPNSCTDSRCGTKGIGATCTANADCGSTFCTDGVCCDEACTELCRACNLSGSVGACANVPQGVADSENTCPATNPDMCGNDGTCDGKGACSKWGSDVSCSMMSCPEGTSSITNPGSCNGMGSCMPGSQQSCGNFLCNAASNTCKTSCTPQTQALDCKDGIDCVDIGGNNSCGLKAQGESCANSTDCSAGLFCVDGTCCNKDKCDTCQSCKNTQGICANVAAGAQDLDSCVSDSVNVCGTTGICNGAGSCRQAEAGTICGESACTANGQEQSKACDGTGTCATSVSSCPNNLRCVGSSCKTSCQSDSDCVGTGIKCRGQSGKCG